MQRRGAARALIARNLLVEMRGHQRAVFPSRTGLSAAAKLVDGIIPKHNSYKLVQINYELNMILPIVTITNSTLLFILMRFVDP